MNTHPDKYYNIYYIFKNRIVQYAINCFKRNIEIESVMPAHQD